MTSGARMLLQYCDVGVTTSWEKAPRERGRPARTNLGIASPISSTRIERQRPMALLRPGLCDSRWQCGRVPHRRETERQPKG